MRYDRSVTSRDLADLSREVIERRERLALLRGSRDPESSDPYSEELAQIEEELEKDSLRLQEFVEELRQLGVEPKNGVEGIVDFPTMFDGHVGHLTDSGRCGRARQSPSTLPRPSDSA